MGGYINSKVVKHPDVKGYKKYDNLNYNDLNCLYSNAEEHFQGDD